MYLSDDVQNALRDGEPRIWIRCDQDMDGNFNGKLTRISPFGLYEGEEDIVGMKLAEELKKLQSLKFSITELEIFKNSSFTVFEVKHAGFVPELCSAFKDIDPSLGMLNCSEIS